MKTTAAFIFFLLCIVLSGCDTRKDDFISKYCPGSCTVIKGRISTANGTKPLSHVPLAAYWTSDDYMFGSSMRKKAVTQTDKNGNYELSFLIRDDELTEGLIVVQPLLDATKFAYCRDEIIRFEYFDLERDVTLLENYEIPEVAFIEFQLTNRGGLPAGDQLTTQFSYTYGKDGQHVCSNNINWSNNSKNSLVVNVAADQPVVLKNNIVRNGAISEEETVLQLQPGERKIVTIAF